jgi:hypothetical protein
MVSCPRLAQSFLLRDSLTAPQICKDFFKSAIGFSLAQRAIYRQLRFSMPTEYTSSEVSIIFVQALSLFLHPARDRSDPAPHPVPIGQQASIRRDFGTVKLQLQMTIESHPQSRLFWALSKYFGNMQQRISS